MGFYFTLLITEEIKLLTSEMTWYKSNPYPLPAPPPTESQALMASREVENKLEG